MAVTKGVVNKTIHAYPSIMERGPRGAWCTTDKIGDRLVVFCDDFCLPWELEGSDDFEIGAYSFDKGTTMVVWDDDLKDGIEVDHRSTLTIKWHGHTKSSHTRRLFEHESWSAIDLLRSYDEGSLNTARYERDSARGLEYYKKQKGGD